MSMIESMYVYFFLAGRNSLEDNFRLIEEMYSSVLDFQALKQKQ